MCKMIDSGYKQPEVERYFGSQFECIVLQGRETTEEGVEGGSWFHCTHSQKAEHEQR